MEKYLTAALAILIFAIASVQFVKGETFYIETTPNSSFCNGSAGPGSGHGAMNGPGERQQCLTLSQFVEEFISNQLKFSNLTLELEPGEHIFDSNLTMTTVVSFAMISQAATINCTLPGFRHFHFYSVRDVLISGITFMDCGQIGVFNTDHFRFENSSFQVIEFDYTYSVVLESVIDIAIIGSTFTQNGHNGVLNIGNGNSILHVQHCTFSHMMNTIGRAIYSANSTVVIIDSSTFEEITSDLRDVKNGTVVEIVSNKESVTLKNCEFVHNTNGNDSHALIAVDGLGSIVVCNNRFTQNTGRVLHILSSANETIIDHNSFVDNTGSGAALDINAKSMSLNISANNFTRNSNGAVKLLISDSTVTVNDCSFSSNSKSGNGGAAMAVYAHDYDDYPKHGDIHISQSSFFNNSVNINGSGGALHISVDSSKSFMQIESSIFCNNSAQQAGAVYLNVPASYTFAILETLFEGNMATEGHAGAVAIEGEAKQLLIVNSTFADNSAPRSSAGAVYISASTIVMGSMFSKNLAQNCGALALTSGDIQILESTFLSNRAAVDGGAICTYPGFNDVSILTVNFSYNRAEESGGVLTAQPLANGEYWNKSTLFQIDGASYFDHNVAGSQGGVFATFTQSDFLIGSSAFFNNLAGIEGGVMYVRDTNSSVGILSDFNSQFSYNRATKRGGVISINGSHLVIGNSLIFNNNSAANGPVISACNSKVVFFLDILYQYNDPIFSNCQLYDVAENRPATAATTPTIPPTRAKDSSGIAIAVSLPIACLLVITLFLAVMLTLGYWKKCKKLIRYRVVKTESDDPDLAPLVDNA